MFNSSQLPPPNRTTSEGILVGDKGRPISPLDNETIVLSVILSIFCVLGTIGNALAFLIYYRKREKGTSSIFILSLAVTDFLTCLINLPYTIISLLLNYRLEYDIVCKIFLYIGTFNVPLSSLIMVAIGIDRYFCICHPFLHVVTVPRAKGCVIVLTIISALLGIIPALSHAIYRQNDNVGGQGKLQNSSLLPSNNGSVSTTANTLTASTTEVFIHGLFLEPDENFLKDLAKQNVDVNYRTEHIGILFPTMSPFASLQIANKTSSLTTTVGTSNDESENLEGVCVQSERILSEQFVLIYQYVYAGTFLFDFIVLAILYALIFNSILVRRARKNKRKRMSCYVSTHCPERATEETQLTNVNGGTPQTTVLKKNSGRFSSVMRDRTLHANIKTAAMLFVVTMGFIISFLPSWLMGLRIVPLKRIVFYMFYINNVINPFIYAFMNRTFRDDLFQLLKSCFRR